MSAHVEDIDRRIKGYILIGVSLLVLTAVTVAVAYIDLPLGWAIALALFIATVKGSLVAAYFMHLIDERKLIYATLILTVFFFFALLLGPMLTEGDDFGENMAPAPVAGEAHAGDHGEEH